MPPPNPEDRDRLGGMSFDEDEGLLDNGDDFGSSASGFGGKRDLRDFGRGAAYAKKQTDKFTKALQELGTRGFPAFDKALDISLQKVEKVRGETKGLADEVGRLSGRGGSGDVGGDWSISQGPSVVGQGLAAPSPAAAVTTGAVAAQQPSAQIEAGQFPGGVQPDPGGSGLMIPTVLAAAASTGAQPSTGQSPGGGPGEGEMPQEGGGGGLQRHLPAAVMGASAWGIRSGAQRSAERRPAIMEMEQFAQSSAMMSGSSMPMVRAQMISQMQDGAAMGAVSDVDYMQGQQAVRAVAPGAEVGSEQFQQSQANVTGLATLQPGLGQAGAGQQMQGLMSPQVANRFLSRGHSIRPGGEAQDINEVFRIIEQEVFGGKEPTPLEVAEAATPGTPGYTTLEFLTGGDHSLIEAWREHRLADISMGSTQFDITDESHFRQTGMTETLGYQDAETAEARISGGAGLIPDESDTHSVMNDFRQAMSEVNENLGIFSGLVGSANPLLGQFGGAIQGALGYLMAFQIMGRGGGGAGGGGRGGGPPLVLGGGGGKPGPAGVPGQQQLPGTAPLIAGGVKNLGRGALRGGLIGMTAGWAGGVAGNYLQQHFMDEEGNIEDPQAYAAANALGPMAMGAGIGFGLAGPVGAVVGGVGGALYGLGQGYDEYISQDEEERGKWYNTRPDWMPGARRDTSQEPPADLPDDLQEMVRKGLISVEDARIEVNRRKYIDEQMGAAGNPYAQPHGLEGINSHLGDPVDVGDPISPATQGMDPEMSKRVSRMLADNPKLYVRSGHRSRDEQSKLHASRKEKGGAHAAPPGTSKHEAGVAVDIGPRSEYSWIESHAAQYGLDKPAPNEPWHLELPTARGDHEKAAVRELNRADTMQTDIGREPGTGGYAVGTSAPMPRNLRSTSTVPGQANLAAATDNGAFLTSAYRVGSTTGHGRGESADFVQKDKPTRAGYRDPFLRKLYDSFMQRKSRLDEVILAHAPTWILGGREMKPEASNSFGRLHGTHLDHLHTMVRGSNVDLGAGTGGKWLDQRPWFDPEPGTIGTTDDDAGGGEEESSSGGGGAARLTDEYGSAEESQVLATLLGGGGSTGAASPSDDEVDYNPDKHGEPGNISGEGAELAARAGRSAGMSGNHLIKMVAISGAETGGSYDPTIEGDQHLANSTWGNSIGLWQIRSLHAQRGTGGERDATRLKDPGFNARSAQTLWTRRPDYGDWTVTHRGHKNSYKSYLGVAREAVEATGDPVDTVSLAPSRGHDLGDPLDLLPRFSSEEPAPTGQGASMTIGAVRGQLPSAEAQMVSSGGRGRGGGGTVIQKLEMNVTLANGSREEVDRLFREIQSRTHRDEQLTSIMRGN